MLEKQVVVLYTSVWKDTNANTSHRFPEMILPRHIENNIGGKNDIFVIQIVKCSSAAAHLVKNNDTEL